MKAKLSLHSWVDPEKIDLEVADYGTAKDIKFNDLHVANIIDDELEINLYWLLRALSWQFPDVFIFASDLAIIKLDKLKTLAGWEE